MDNNKNYLGCIKRKGSILIVKKNSFFVLVLIATVFTVFAEQYQITDIQYELDGRTKEYALDKALDIRKDHVLESEEELQLYVDFISQKLSDQRVLENTQVRYELGAATGEGIIPVTLFIIADETWNILPLPYPKYDSNSGFTLKLKVKDYNFFGTMEPLNFDLEFYQEDEGTTNVLGLGIDFSIPFALGVLDAQWNNNASIDYTFGDSSPNFSFSTGLDLAYAFKYVTLKMEAKQSVGISNDYKEAGDWIYGTEFLKFSTPVTLLHTTGAFGNITFTPYTSITYHWDLNGIKHPDLVGPDIGLGYGFSVGKVNWIGNFRKGFTSSITNSYGYNFHTTDWTTGLAFQFEGFYFIDFIGISTRSKIFTHYDIVKKRNSTTTNVAEWMRGIYNGTSYNSGQANMPTGFVMNLDFPIRVLETDWRGWGKAIFKRDMPSWFGFFDFEMQFVPFIDIALYGADDYCLVHFDDGFYSAGLEVILYPNKMRSIQVRASAGLDFAARLMDHDWRDKKGLEIEIGIGLHY